MVKNKKLKKRDGLSKKTKILLYSVMLGELFYLFRGNRLYGLVIFMITLSIFFILSDREDEEIDNSEIEKIKKSIKYELTLIKKSMEKLNYPIASTEKLNEISEYLNSITEKYLFVKKNYGEERGEKILNKLIEELDNLNKALKEINDKLLDFYVTENNDKTLNEDLEYIINRLEAHKNL